jgi:hypothetical protein
MPAVGAVPGGVPVAGGVPVGGVPGGTGTRPGGGGTGTAEISAESEQVRRQVERLVSLSFLSSQQPVMQPRRVFQVVS